MTKWVAYNEHDELVRAMKEIEVLRRSDEVWARANQQKDREIEKLTAEIERLTAEHEKLHQFAVGMFWAGEKLPESTADEIRAYGLDAKQEIERLTAERDHWREECMSADDEINRLQSRVEKLEGEARRLWPVYEAAYDLLYYTEKRKSIDIEQAQERLWGALDSSMVVTRFTCNQEEEYTKSDIEPVDGYCGRKSSKKGLQAGEIENDCSDLD